MRNGNRLTGEGTWHQRVTPFGYLPLDVMARPDLSDRDKVIFAALMMHALTSGRCWPAQEVLAQETARCVRSVKSSIAALKRAGLVQVWRRKQPSAIYALCLTGLRLTPIQEGTAGAPQRLQEGSDLALKVHTTPRPRTRAKSKAFPRSATARILRLSPGLPPSCCRPKQPSRPRRKPSSATTWT